ncbi:MAG TPA: polysaccharide deacetylase family protein [Acidimicrobiales bacterium]|nr:polysaccharide deacetylase family protein [Acidimicrobiales bacterium]
MIVRSAVALLVLVASCASFAADAGATGRRAAQRTRVVAASTASGRRIAPRPMIPIAVATTERTVAISFDDGPDPRWTPAVLDALAEADARATFFVTGQSVRAYPDLVRAIVVAGHEIANHTDTHPQFDDIDAATVAVEVREATEAIVSAGVEAAPFFRPPRGRYGADTLRVVDAAGLRSVGWTVCLERWLRRRGPVRGVDDAVRQTAPGGIIVAHDGGIPDRSLTVAALPTLLTRLRGEGFRIVTVSDLLRLGPAILGRPGESAPNTPYVTGLRYDVRSVITARPR